MESFTPIVITSKAANQDIVDIKAKHAQIVRDMENQAQRVKMFNEQKAQKAENEKAAKMNIALKQQELAAKIQENG